MFSYSINLKGTDWSTGELIVNHASILFYFIDRESCQDWFSTAHQPVTYI